MHFRLGVFSRAAIGPVNRNEGIPRFNQHSLYSFVRTRFAYYTTIKTHFVGYECALGAVHPESSYYAIAGNDTGCGENRRLRATGFFAI